MRSLDHGFGVGCASCSMRLDPALYKAVIPPDSFELQHFKSHNTYSPWYGFGSEIISCSFIIFSRFRDPFA